MNKLNWELFAPLFHESWHLKMQPIIESEEVYNIYQKLKEIGKSGKRILPNSKDVFRSFKETRLDDIKVVWVLQSPYPNLYRDGSPQANGIPMDCSYSKDGVLQPSLTKFYDAIQHCYKEEVDYSPDLTYLLKQGVFLLNSDLTVEARKSDSHEGMWAPFMKQLFEDILQYQTGTIYVFSGKPSKRLEKYVNPISNYIFYTEHPAAASYSQRAWNYDNIFTIINSIIKQNRGEENEIIWNKAKLNKLIDDLPF